MSNVLFSCSVCSDYLQKRISKGQKQIEQMTHFISEGAVMS